MEGFTLFKPPVLFRAGGSRTIEPPYELAYHGVYTFESYEEDEANVLTAVEVAVLPVCLDYLYEHTGVGRESYGLDLQYTDMFVPHVPLRPRRKVWLGFYGVAAGHLRILPRAWPVAGVGGWSAEKPCKHCGSTGGHRELCPKLGQDAEPASHLRVPPLQEERITLGQPSVSMDEWGGALMLDSANMTDAQRYLSQQLLERSGLNPILFAHPQDRISNMGATARFVRYQRHGKTEVFRQARELMQREPGLKAAEAVARVRQLVAASGDNTEE